MLEFKFMKTIYIITPSSNISNEIKNDKNIKKQIKKAEDFFKKINIKLVYWKLFWCLWYFYGLQYE